MVSIKELRSHRVYGMAIFDLVSSIIGMILIFLLARWNYWPKEPILPFIVWGAVLAIPFGIVLHVLVGQNTALNQRLGLSVSPLE